MKIRLQTSRPLIRDILSWSFVALAAAALRAGDWPQYRGPNHDGISTETIRTNWSEQPPRQVWKVPLDPGLSSFVVAGSNAFTLVRTPGPQPTTEYCIALDADTGAQLWATPIGVAYYPNGGVGNGSDDGPRSTPTIDGDRVYVLGSYLDLLCLNAANGQVVWSNNVAATYGGSVIPWQSAASPLLEGDSIFVHCNAAASNQRLLAFRKQDGIEAWHGPNDQEVNNRMTQSTPVAATIAGVRQVVFFAQSGLVAVVPETGAVLWRYPFPYSTSTAASPVVGEDVVYCSAAYGAGAGTVRITNSGGQLITNEVWRIPFANPLMNHWATPVLHGGYLFGIYGQQGPTVLLRCIDFASGEQKWNQSGVGTGGGVLFVAGHVLVLTEDGNLLLVKPDPTAYTEVARYRALDGSSNSIPGIVRCWNVPAISNGRIYARSTTEAVCLDVTATPPLKLLSTLTSGTSLFQLLIGNADGSPLDTNRAANIDVFASTDLTLGLSGWIKLNSSTTLTNGRLSLDDPQSPATAQRFFRVEERP